MRGGPVRWLAFRPLQLTAAQAIGGRPGLLVLAALLRALAPATLPAATQPATQADVAEDDADRGALAAQPEVAAPLSRLAVRRHDPRWEPGALAAHAGICAGGGEQSPSLPRLLKFQGLINTLLFVDIAWRILVPLRRSPCSNARPVRGVQSGLRSGPRARQQRQRRGAPRACHWRGDPAMEFEDAGRCLSRMPEDLHVCF